MKTSSKPKEYKSTVDKVVKIMKWKDPVFVHEVTGGWLCIWDSVSPVLKKLWDLDGNSAEYTKEDWLKFYKDFEEQVLKKTEVAIKIQPTIETGLRNPHILVLDSGNRHIPLQP